MSATVSSTSASSYTPASDATSAGRIASLDIVKGVVMVLMAIDHVRVYSGVPAGAPVPGVFFTRWITHFVAPAFAFFAGTSIYLHARKLGDARATSRFLLTRGLWLVFLELTVLRLAWTFNVDYAHYMLAGVIWMLGWCMILMAAMSRMSVRANAVAGGAIVLLHNTLDYTHGLGDKLGALWTLLYGGGVVQLGQNGPPLFVLYVIVPWIGVMMLGYAFGAIVVRPDAERRKLIWRIGAAATAAFVLLRVLDVYGDPRHWHAMKMPALLAFLNATKYPASLQFLLMTLGPALLLLAAVDRARGPVSRVLATFGRVPFFYYVLHIPLIHAAACVVSLIRVGHVDPWLFTNFPMAPGDQPAGYMWSLGLLYLVWAICVALLYVPCRWFARVRATRRNPWLSYL
ncbi:MAG TPA: heparan-alpha-glucosaminide N-acetyltransferase domain-containing protein [Gemmatimonadaceae bacterium]|nr:heparan-alpha-glucosaminide N-acetyltransferase domain-containing protein [Gemmatimonadaceae bacterium]